MMKGISDAKKSSSVRMEAEVVRWLAVCTYMSYLASTYFC